MESEQIKFWCGEFGKGYMSRNAPTADVLRSRIKMWAQVLAPIEGRMPRTVLEVGANVGNNLRAMSALAETENWALEPFAQAREKLLADGVVPADRIVQGTAEKIDAADGSFDFVFTSGVLIHIAPENLLPACREIHRVSRRYVMCAEYFSADPAERSYRGEHGYLFKRDFGSFYMDNFPNLKLVDYGFLWRRITGLDDLTWWLFEKSV